MNFDLPKRGDVIYYNYDDGGAELPMQVVTYPLEIPRHKLSPTLHHTTCWDLEVRYLADHPTGALHSTHSLILRGDELHFWSKAADR